MFRPSRRRGERGASVLELAIIAPSLLTLIFFSIQTALFLFGRAAALNAAQEGVSELRQIQPQVYSDSLADRIKLNTETYARRIAGNSLLNAKATYDYDETTGIASMTVEGNPVSLVPGLNLTTKRTATGQIESFEADK
jgi:Flp pilus assembly protein TadG